MSSYDQSARRRALPITAGDSRATFVTRTYLHLLGAIIAFTLIEMYLFQSGLAATVAQALSSMHWGLVMGGFVLIGWLATRFAHTAQSLPVQYLALAAYVVADAIIFVPMLYMAQSAAGGGVIEKAAYVTLLGFGVLTCIAWGLRKDFSFLRGVMIWGGCIALAAIVGSFIFGYDLGFYFSVAMVALAGASILYDTSNVIHHYDESRYVGAALSLFASVAMMFWYVLRLLTQRD